MTAINTIEDLVQVLDEHPAWLEALRARLLTRDLVELPETLARLAARLDRFAETTNERFDQIDERLNAMDRRFDGIDGRLDGMDQRLDGMDQRLDGMDQRLDGMDQRLDGMDQRLDKVEHRLDGVEGRLGGVEGRLETVESGLNALRNDVAPLKAAHARNAAVENATGIARSFGLRRIRTLTQDDLWDLTDSIHASDVPSNELESFRRADLIMEVTDEAGESSYIAVEISFTVNGRDTDRAIRNTAFLTKWTGRPARAVVAGFRRDDRIQGRIESGDVSWHQLDAEDLEVE